MNALSEQNLSVCRGLTIQLFFHSFRGWKPKTELTANLASPEASLLVLQRVVFPLCLHMDCLYVSIMMIPLHLFIRTVVMLD